MPPGGEVDNPLDVRLYSLTSARHSACNVLLVDKNLCKEIHPTTSVKRTPFNKAFNLHWSIFIGLTEVHDRIRYAEEEKTYYFTFYRVSQVIFFNMSMFFSGMDIGASCFLLDAMRHHLPPR